VNAYAECTIQNQRLKVVPLLIYAEASIPILGGGRSLHPVKNRVGSFDKVVDQNFTHIFQYPPLAKLPPYFLLLP